MVHYFTSNVVNPPFTLFMGIDKMENEELIKWGWPEDVWFHVDKLSSAHVYLRLQSGQTIKDIPPALLEDAAQLVKANSISGCKMESVDVVYTLWPNLKKTNAMEPGQVAFHNDKEVFKIKVEKKSEIVNRLTKTKKTESPDLRAMREERDQKEKEENRKLQRELKKRKIEEEKRKHEEAELRSYTTLMKTENMTSNLSNDGYDSDDFM